MEFEISQKTEQKDDEIVVIIEQKEIPSVEQDRDGRYSVTAYSQSDSHGNGTQNHPTFLIGQTQRVSVRTYGKGFNAKVSGASLNHQASHAYFNIPPEGGMFDLIPGYWNLTVLGSWSSYFQGNWVAGGIFAEVNYR